MNSDYEDKGFVVFKNVFVEAELKVLREVVVRFHQAWILDNADFYAEKAINSAYLTGKKYLADSDRELLFEFLGSTKLMNAVNSFLDEPTFVNTQLFFDPVNKDQTNYWHRDSQYHLSLEDQKAALLGPNVLHFRLPLFDEPGVELVPGTHRRWDSDEELNVRLEQNGRKNHENLSTGVPVPLNAGDLLVFSAKMIHRGQYGMNRLALDILFADPVPELLKFVDTDCLPDHVMLKKLEDPNAFLKTMKIKTNNK